MKHTKEKLIIAAKKGGAFEHIKLIKVTGIRPMAPVQN